MNETGEDRPVVDGDAALADWVAELAERLEGGDPIDLEALARERPDQADELRRILPTMRRMASFGHAVANDLGSIESPTLSGRGGSLGTLGDFVLIREVGRGGMGVVYEAEQISLQRRVALKVLPLAAILDHRHHQRFLLEARAAACLHHAHIVPVYGVGSERGVPYYAMQFIDGCTLAQVVHELRDHEATGVPDRAARSLASTLRPRGAGSSLGASYRDEGYIRHVADLGRQAAEALDHAHSRGILHRDIKPGNLMFDAEGHLWITDFGLAQIQGDSRLTLTGDVLGTLRYMSPEQALAKRVVIDGRTDIYALGATLYELLTLRPVFDGKDRAEVIRRIAQDEATPLRKLNAAVPKDLETIVLKTLEKDPSARYASAKDLAEDLGRLLDARTIAARSPGRWERIGKWGRRNRPAVLSAATFAAVAFIALGTGLIWSNSWLRRHNERLRIERDRSAEFSRELETQRDLAERRRRIADGHIYAFRLRQAGEALRARQFEKAQEILLDLRPEPGEDDLREFAWHHLWRESRREVAILSERTERVWVLALSSDGRTVATGDRDGTIRLRDVATGEVRVQFRGIHQPVGAIAFSADGRWLATGVSKPEGDGESRGELILWDTATGRSMATLDGFEPRWISGLQFDRSGEYLWERSGIENHRAEIRLWQLGAGLGGLRPRLLRSWPGGIGLTVSADGRRIASLADDKQVIMVEDPFTEQVLCRLPRVPLGYHGFTLSENGELIAAARPHDSDHSLRIAVWTTAGGAQLTDGLAGLGGGLVDHMAFSPDGRELVAHGTVGPIGHYDLDTGRAWLISEEVGHCGSDFSILPGGRLLASSFRGDFGGIKPVRIHERAGGDVRAAFPGRVDLAANMFGLPDGRSLVFRSGNQAIAWHFEPPTDTQPAGHRSEAWAAGFSPDGRVLATGSDDVDESQTLKLWDASSGQLMREWKAHPATTGAVAWQPGGTILASAGLTSKENLRLWDAESGTMLGSLEGHTDKVRSVTFSPDGRVLASAGSDGTIRLWDVTGRRCTHKLTGHADTIRQVAFSANGRTLASVGNDSVVRLWDVQGGGATRSLWTGGTKIAAVAFSPDRRTIAWGHADGVIQRWDLSEDRLLPPLHSEYGELRCLAFSPDGRTLAAAGKSGTIHLWDPVIGQELLTLDGLPRQINALAFSPDGASLAACWHDGTVRLFRAR